MGCGNWGGNNCLWIIILFIIIFGCGGWGGCGNNSVGGCGCGGNTCSIC